MHAKDKERGNDLRQVMRSVAATVTVVSTAETDRRFGMVATAVLSLTLDPPSLAVAVNQSASIHDPIARRGVFCINILSKEDERVGRGFAELRGEQRFSAGAWSRKSGGLFDGVPYLESSLATIFCQVTAQVEAGTHTLFVGEVEEVLNGAPHAPLLYCEGDFGSFEPAPHLADECRVDS